MIYLDNAATTAMYPECLDSFKKYGVEKKWEIIRYDDVRTDDFLIECKTTANNYYILSRNTWEKIENEALKDGIRVPILQVQLENGVSEIVVMSIHDFLTLELDKGRTFLGGKEPLLLDRMSFRVTDDFKNVADYKEIPKEVFYFRQDVKLVEYNIHLVMLDWNDFLYMIEEE